MEKFAGFARIAEIEFQDIVLSTQDLGNKLRIYLKDKTFVDFFYTTNLKNQRFAIHWERKHIDGKIYRIDNTPDKKWVAVSTFPVHFHKGSYKKVLRPPFNVKEAELEDLLRKFLAFAKGIST